MKIKRFTGIVTVLTLSVTLLLTGCGNSTTGKISSIDDGSSIESDISFNAKEEENRSSSVSEMEIDSSDVSQNSDASSITNDSSGSFGGVSSQSLGSGNISKPMNLGKPDNGGAVNNPTASENSGNNQPSKPSDNGSGLTKPENTTDTQPSVHTHNFVDVGVKSMDWTYSPELGYTGPTRTREKVSAINACLGCGHYYGNDEGELFSNRYAEHIFVSNTSGCGGAYSLRTVYACYHLLECTTPGCYAYRRGDLDHYEYLIYFNGNGEEPTAFILEDWQIKELGLPMP